MNIRKPILPRKFCYLCIALLLSSVSSITMGLTTRASVNSFGLQANKGSSTSSIPSISYGGRFVAFGSTSDNLVQGGIKNIESVYFRDRLTGKTSRISSNVNGTTAPGMFPSMNSTGRFVTFESWVDTVAKGDKNNFNDVFVHDNLTGINTLVSVSTKGVQGNSGSNKASISGNGRFVVFESFADNLVPGDTNGYSDIFVRDLVKKETTRVSVSSTGRQGDSYSGAGSASISADGRFVVFTSLANNLVPGDKNKGWDAFLHDRSTNSTYLITSDTIALGGSEAKINAGGRYVEFFGVLHHDTPEAQGFTLIYDIFTGQYTPGIVDIPGVTNAGGNPSISGNARLLAFEGNTADNIQNIFIQDQLTNQTFLVSASTLGVRGKNHSLLPVISADGLHIAYLSFAGNLVAGDTNRAVDVFVLDLAQPR